MTQLDQPKKLTTESDLEVLLPDKPPEPELVPRWATVTRMDPLAVQFDGPNAELYTPVHKSLSRGLIVGTRVQVHVIRGTVVIAGAVNGGTIATALSAASAYVYDGLVRIGTATIANGWPINGVGYLEVTKAGNYVVQKFTPIAAPDKPWIRTASWDGSAWVWTSWFGDVVSTNYGTLSQGSWPITGGGHEKKADGKLECWVRCRITPVANVATFRKWTFPVPFVYVPTVNVTPSTGATTVQTTMESSPTVNDVDIGVLRSNTTDTHIDARAVGFWRAP